MKQLGVFTLIVTFVLFWLGEDGCAEAVLIEKGAILLVGLFVSILLLVAGEKLEAARIGRIPYGRR